ncbi:MAG TPA: 6-phosphogluconolactonase, partial [Acidimicrobiia bacterium]|nr:6-phosphogluconolactonase [Acidimicrobiia bacterium]
MEVIVHKGPEDVARAVAARIAGEISLTNGRFTLGLSGGTTPIATYERLRQLDVDWSNVDTWISDERWVPPDHQRSNGRMAEETLIRHVGARFHRPGWAEHLTAEDIAPHYEAVIREIHRGHRPDMVHLGMGDDGHTASLFPGTSALDERERWIIANHVPQAGEVRLTSTYPLLWQ